MFILTLLPVFASFSSRRDLRAELDELIQAREMRSYYGRTWRDDEDEDSDTPAAESDDSRADDVLNSEELDDVDEEELTQYQAAPGEIPQEFDICNPKISGKERISCQALCSTTMNGGCFAMAAASLTGAIVVPDPSMILRTIMIGTGIGSFVMCSANIDDGSACKKKCGYSVRSFLNVNTKINVCNKGQNKEQCERNGDGKPATIKQVHKKGYGLWALIVGVFKRRSTYHTFTYDDPRETWGMGPEEKDKMYMEWADGKGVLHTKPGRAWYCSKDPESNEVGLMDVEGTDAQVERTLTTLLDPTTRRLYKEDAW